MKAIAGAMLVGLLSARCAPAAASAVNVGVFKIGPNEYAIDIVADSSSTAARSWDVLTDYDHHAQYVPYLTASRIAETGADHKVVDQEGRIRVLFWTFTMRVTENVRETPPELMQFNAVAGDFRELAGQWTITPTASGVQWACHLKLEPRRRVPLWAVRFATKRYLTAMVQAMIGRAESGTS